MLVNEVLERGDARRYIFGGQLADHEPVLLESNASVSLRHALVQPLDQLLEFAASVGDAGVAVERCVDDQEVIFPAGGVGTFDYANMVCTLPGSANGTLEFLPVWS